MKSNIIGVAALSAALGLLCGCLHSSAPTSPEAASWWRRQAERGEAERACRRS